MKIQKVEYALGSNILDLKKYFGKNYTRVLETTGIKKPYHNIFWGMREPFNKHFI